MRFFTFCLSILLHAGLVAYILYAPPAEPLKIRLDVPIYHVDLVTLKGKPGPRPKPVRKKAEAPKPVPKPAPAPAPEPQVAPKPEPVKAPEPKPEPKPVPKPKPEEISPKKVEKKPEPKKAEAPKPLAKKPAPKKPAKPKKKEPTAQQLLAQALKETQKNVKKQEDATRKALEDELARMREAVAEQDEVLEEGEGGQGGTSDVGAANLAEVYIVIVGQAVKEKWRFPQTATNENLVCTVRLTLDPTGVIQNYVLTQESGRPDFDASALKAVAETGELPPPPKPELQVFDINFNLQELQ